MDLYMVLSRLKGQMYVNLFYGTDELEHWLNNKNPHLQQVSKDSEIWRYVIESWFLDYRTFPEDSFLVISGHPIQLDEETKQVVYRVK